MTGTFWTLLSVGFSRVQSHSKEKSISTDCDPPLPKKGSKKTSHENPKHTLISGKAAGVSLVHGM